MPKLIVTSKSGRHRKDHSYDMSEEQATDPIERASFIRGKLAFFDKVVNWKIV